MAVVITSPHLDAAIAFKNFQYTAERRRSCGRRPVSGRSTRPSLLISGTSFRCRRNCGRSPTWAAGARSIRSCSTRAPAASPRSTCRPPDDGPFRATGPAPRRSAPPRPRGSPWVRPVGQHVTSGRCGDAVAFGDRAVAAGRDRVAGRGRGLAGLLAVSHVERRGGVVPGDAGDFRRSDRRQSGLRSADRLGAGARRLRRQKAGRRRSSICRSRCRPSSPAW